MRKNILKLLLLICLVVPASMMLVACNNEHNHKYGTWIYNGAERYRICEECSFKDSNVKTVYETDGNGKVEVCHVTEDRVVFKPVPNEGYYFLEWEFNDNGGGKTEGILDTVNTSKYRYKACFTNDSSLIQPLTFDIEVENDLDVKVEYLSYVTKSRPQISFYVHENDNLVLEKAVTVAGSNRFPYVNEGVEILPYSRYVDANPFDTPNVLEYSVYLKFKDTTDKSILTIEETNSHPKINHYLYDKNEKVTVNTKDFVFEGKFLSWTSQNGEILSNNEEFEFIITENTTIYLNLKEYEYTYFGDGGIQMYFSKNLDNTLSLESFSGGQFSTIEIPSVVNGLNVTTIGMLKWSDFGGKLIIPDSIVNFEPYAFKYLGVDLGVNSVIPLGNPLIAFASERTDLMASDFYGCNEKVTFDFSETTIRHIVENELNKLMKDYLGLNVIFADEMPENTFGYYTGGTQNITIKGLLEGEVWNRNLLNVIVHELRHYYQEVAIGNHENFGVDDLISVPTDNQIGAWKYTDYTSPDEDYNKYYYSAREIDAREYALAVVGFELIENEG